MFAGFGRGSCPRASKGDSRSIIDREGTMAARVEVREISNEEGNRLLRMVRRSSGSVVTWRRAQIVLLAAQRMPPTRIAEVVFSDPDTVREVIHNFNRDGFDALYPRYRAAGRAPSRCRSGRRSKGWRWR